MTRRTHAALAGLAAAALAVGGAAPATGSGKPKTKTKVEITKIGATGAKGTVSSKEEACEPRRKVSLYLVGDYVPVKVGKTKTKPSGKWKVQADLEPGRYLAKVKKSVLDGGTCKAAQSKAERVR